MSYIKRYNQINEELKRKLSPAKLKKQQEDDEQERIEKRPADLFTEEEIKILKHEDFEINESDQEAKCVDKGYTFVIKKSFSLDDKVSYSLTITKGEEEIYTKKIIVAKKDRRVHLDTLDFLIDKSAYILEKIKKEAMKAIDPYGEEEWDEEDKEKILKKKQEPLPFGPFPNLPGNRPEDKGRIPARPKPIKYEKKPEIEDIEDPDPEIEDDDLDDILGHKKVRGIYKAKNPILNQNIDPQNIEDEFKRYKKNRIQELIDLTDIEVKDELLGRWSMEDLLDLDYEGVVAIINGIKNRKYPGQKDIIRRPKNAVRSDILFDLKNNKLLWKTAIDNADEEDIIKDAEARGFNVKSKKDFEDIKNALKLIPPMKHMNEPPKAKKKRWVVNEECHFCQWWGRDEKGNKCDGCDGTGRRKIEFDNRKDYMEYNKKPHWSIGGASDMSYGS